MNRVRVLASLMVTILVLAFAVACGQQAPAAPPAAQKPAEAPKQEAPKAAAPTEAPKAPAPAAPTQAPAAAPTTAPAAPKATEAPKAASTRGAGGQLKILYWQAPTILNPHLAQGTKDFHAAMLALEPLAWYLPDGKLSPALAAEIPTRENGGISADGKTITWKLKQGVKWSDGSDFTADDAVFTYTYCKDEKTACTNAAITKGIEKVEAVDKNTVRVTFAQPTANPYQIFVSDASMIIQKKQFEAFIGEKAKEAPGNLKPIGTGPYMIREFKPGDVVTYDINPTYREAGKPYFKEVQFKGGGDATSAARAVFQTGEADYGWNLQVPWAALGPLVQAPSSRGDLVVATSSNIERLLINFADPNTEVNGAKAEPTTKHPILSDIKVRQALALAIDRKKIADQLYGQTGKATCNIVIGVPAYESKNTKCDPDPAAAEKLLEDAGWKKGADGIRVKDGKRLKLVYQTTVNPVRQATQDLVKADWAKIGVETELKAVNAGVFFSSDEGNPDTAAKFYTDIQMFTNGSVEIDPTNYVDGWTTKEITQASNKWRGSNYHRWSNPEYDKVVEELRRTLDPAKRNELIIKANDILINEVVVIPLVARTSPTSAKAKDLKGPLPNPWSGELFNIADWTK